MTYITASELKQSRMILALIPVAFFVCCGSDEGNTESASSTMNSPLPDGWPDCDSAPITLKCDPQACPVTLGEGPRVTCNPGAALAVDGFYDPHERGIVVQMGSATFSELGQVIISVDPTSGDRRVITGKNLNVGMVGEGPELNLTHVFSHSAEELLGLQSDGSLVRVSRKSGDRVLWPEATAALAEVVPNAKEITAAAGEDGRVILAVKSDSGAGYSYEIALLRTDTVQCTLVSSWTGPSDPQNVVGSGDLGITEAETLVISGDEIIGASHDKDLFSVQLQTGERKRISRLGGVGTGDWDVGTNTLAVRDGIAWTSDFHQLVILVDLKTGMRTLGGDASRADILALIPLPEREPLAVLNGDYILLYSANADARILLSSL